MLGIVLAPTLSVVFDTFITPKCNSKSNKNTDYNREDVKVKIKWRSGYFDVLCATKAEVRMPCICHTVRHSSIKETS